MANKHAWEWFKAIKKDLEAVVQKNFDLEKTLGQMKLDNEYKDARIALLEEAVLNSDRNEDFKKIDTEQLTMMLTGFKHNTDPTQNRTQDFQTYLQNTLPDLSHDINADKATISLNGTDAKNPTAFIKFHSKKAAFSAAKKFSTSDRKNHSMRSCLPKEIREKKAKTLQRLKENPQNNGWVCQVSLGTGNDRNILFCRRAKQKNDGSRPTNWEEIEKVGTGKDKKQLPLPKTAQDPQLMPLDCTELECEYRKQ